MKRIVLAVTASLALTSCAGAEGELAIPDSTLPTLEPPPEPPVQFPGEEWTRNERGDWDALDAELAATRSTCVAVIQNGELVHDAGFNGSSPTTPTRVYSITKSMAALLVGMGVDDGSVDLDQPVADFVPQWESGATSAISVRDLLSMTSGRAWSEATDSTMINSVADQTTYAVGLGQAREPGEWQYDNTATQVLEPVIAGSVAEGDVAAMAQSRLLDPLGMSNTTWARDQAGNGLTYSGARSSCHDMARFGYLVLHKGRWNDDQLVSSEFIDQLSQPSSDRNAAYGFLWWNNSEGRIVEVLRQAGFETDKAPYDGRIAPSVPEDAIWAFGYGNQYVAVVPSADLVAVRLGSRPQSADRVTFDSFTAAVLEGLS